MPESQLPLLPEVTLDMSFEDIFERRRVHLPDSLRRQRWETWKRLCAEDGRRHEVSLAVLDIWTDCDGCHGDTPWDGPCRHLDGDWCTSEGLPAAVNPVISFRSGMPGMACIGLGYTPRSHLLKRAMRRGRRAGRRRLNKRRAA